MVAAWPVNRKAVMKTMNWKFTQSLVTMSRVTYFTPQAHTGNCISPNTAIKQGEDLEGTKMQVNGLKR